MSSYVGMELIASMGSSWSWSYSSWIYDYLCNQSLWPPTLWVRTPLRWGVLDTTLCDKFFQWLATGLWFSPGTPVSSTNKSDRHDTTEILLKVVLSTINQAKPLQWLIYFVLSVQFLAHQAQRTMWAFVITVSVVVVRVCKLFIFSSSFLKPLNRFGSNLSKFCPTDPPSIQDGCCY